MAAKGSCNHTRHKQTVNNHNSISVGKNTIQLYIQIISESLASQIVEYIYRMRNGGYYRQRLNLRVATLRVYTYILICLRATLNMCDAQDQHCTCMQINVCPTYLVQCRAGFCIVFMYVTSAQLNHYAHSYYFIHLYYW